MLLSICIVNLNAKKYLSKCLNSIPKGLKTQDYEIIIVDNNSSDNSCSFIKNLKNNLECWEQFEGPAKYILTVIKV